MDLTTLNSEASISVQAIALWVASGLLIAAVILLIIIRIKKRPKFLDYLGDEIIVILSIAALFLAVLGVSSVESNKYHALNESFQVEVTSVYGLKSNADLHTVKTAAKHGGTVQMSDESGTFDVRPHLDGDKLTFTKPAKEEPIEPRK